jgi:hypothetical protein
LVALQMMWALVATVPLATKFASPLVMISPPELVATIVHALVE